MKRTPRHTLLRTAAALTLLLPALTACTIVSRTVPAADEPITFASFLPDVTKAMVESEADMTEFAVWGWHTAADGADPTDIFNGELIYRDGTGATAPWTYDVPRFWVEGHYDFYALHPFPFTGADGSEVTAACTAEGITSITLNSPNADIDLMTATASRDYPSEGDGAVAFTFDHLLSRVSIQAEAGAGAVQITSLTFSGMYVGGNCNPATASWDFTDRTADGSISLPESSGPVKVTPSEPVPVLPDLLMIPQTPGSSCTITLTWTLNGTKQDPVSLTVPADPAWTAARHYIYTLKLNDVVDVTLNINVRDWNERNYSITF